LVYMPGVDSNPAASPEIDDTSGASKAALSGYLGEACCKIGSWRTIGRYKMMDKHHSGLRGTLVTLGACCISGQLG